MHGIALFDTQLLAGMAMARGAIAEMATGEGKTLAAALPAMLFSLRGAGVHVATPNAYLAQRDFEQVGPILQLLGTSVGLVPEVGRRNAKRAAYACDVAYATGYELGFDYLRDQLQVMSAPRPGLGERQLELLRGRPSRQPPAVQPRRNCAIIDEIDSVLIDEACLPLVLSDSSESAGRQEAYLEAQRVAASLREGDDFVLDRTGPLGHADPGRPAVGLRTLRGPASFSARSALGRIHRAGPGVAVSLPAGCRLRGAGRSRDAGR